MKPGDYLTKGQGICKGTPKYTNNIESSTQGAYEFGLDENGCLTFYDHLNQDPEVVVWQNKDMCGDVLRLEDDGRLVLYGEDGNPVGPGLGVCDEDIKGTVQFEAKMDDSMELRAGSKTLWSIALDGVPTGDCV